MVHVFIGVQDIRTRRCTLSMYSSFVQGTIKSTMGNRMIRNTLHGVGRVDQAKVWSKYVKVRKDGAHTALLACSRTLRHARSFSLFYRKHNRFSNAAEHVQHATSTWEKSFNAFGLVAPQSLYPVAKKSKVLSAPFTPATCDKLVPGIIYRS